MANGLLKKLVLGTAIAGSALFGVKEARASTLDWSSFSEVVGAIPEGYSQSYTSSNSSILPNRCSGILHYEKPEYGSVAIGGFDLVNGVVTLSYFGDVGEEYIANTGSSANPAYSWEVFYDFDGDGGYEAPYNGYIANRTEQLNPSQFSITEFTKYGTQPGTFNFSSTVPEPTVLTYLLLGGAVTAALRRRRESNKKQFLA